MSYLRNRIKSFEYAFAGLKAALKTEVHLKLFTIIAICVIVLGIIANITLMEWMFVLSAIVLVISLELVNSAIEKLCNLVDPQKNNSIKYIKDVMAASVFLASIYAAIVGTMIAWHYFFKN